MYHLVTSAGCSTRPHFLCRKLYGREACYLFFFFFNDTATTEIYTLPLPDALPIYFDSGARLLRRVLTPPLAVGLDDAERDRKSTRLNSSHDQISYAVFCLKKKKRH